MKKKELYLICLFDGRVHNFFDVLLFDMIVSMFLVMILSDTVDELVERLSK
jgi:hypothetical protein